MNVDANQRFRQPKLRSPQWHSRFDVPLSTLDEFDEPLSFFLRQGAPAGTATLDGILTNCARKGRL
jgi:hypothetical protein